MDGTSGIHHVTAICTEPALTVDFYSGTLGVRFLKRTVNFDDPTTYHLYFGDEVGHPGTALTFFAWSNLPRGRPGTGQAVRVSFKVPRGSLGWWKARLDEHDVPHEDEIERFGRRVLPFQDPDGMGSALVEWDEVEPGLQWRDGPVPEDRAIAGFHGVTLQEASVEATHEVLTEVLGFERSSGGDGRTEYVARGRRGGGGDDEAPLNPTIVEVVHAPSAAAGRVARGSIHHVAYRAEGEEHQASLRRRLVDAGLGPTPVIDRYYFESVYFHEPGGVLFEIATDGPGFTRDQSPEELGKGLTLPPWLEPRRELIEARLEPFRV